MTQAVTEPQPARGKGDWALAASMLAEGRGVMETARAAGVSRTSLWRALNRSADFVRLIERRRAELAAESGGRLDAMRALVAEQIEDKLRAGDTRTVLWMLRELGMVGRGAALFGRIEPVAEPNLESIERVASEQEVRRIGPAPVPPDGDPAETRRALIQTRFAYNKIYDALERTKAELDALKAANAAAPAPVEASAAVAAPATAAVAPLEPEPEAKSVPTVPSEDKSEADQQLSVEPAGSNPVPPPFQEVPAPATPARAEPVPSRPIPPGVLERVARSEAARMRYCSRR